MPVIVVILLLIERVRMDEVIERRVTEAAVESGQRLAQNAS